MKKYFIDTMKFVLTTFCVALCLASYQGRAQWAQYWDNNGTGTATSGNWDNTSTFWASNTATASTVPFTNGNFAVFSVGSAAITTLNINVPNQVTCDGIGNGNVAYNNGVNTIATGVAVDSLTFSGAGSINLPSGLQQFCCGGSGVQNTYLDLPIVGLGGIEQRNTGQLYLYGINTYSGGTEMTGGQVIFYNSTSSFGTGAIIYNGGGSGTSVETTNSPSNPVTITNAWTIDASSPVLNFATGDTTCTGPMSLGNALQIKNSGAGSTSTRTNLTMSGVISGAFGVNWATPNFGMITVNGQNTYTGPTIIGIAGGTTFVTVTNINSVSTPAQQTYSCMGKPSSVFNGTIEIGATNAATGATLIYTGPGETSDRQINLVNTTTPDTIEMDGTGPLILNGLVEATGNGLKTLILQGTSTAANAINGVIANGPSLTSFTKTQAGSWTLGGVNTFTGNMTNSGGTLTIGGSGKLGSGSYGGFFDNTATFIYDSSANQTLSGVIEGAGTIEQSGSGTLTLTGTNTYTGSTTIDSSTALTVGGNGKLGNGTYPDALTDNGTFNFNSTSGETLSGLISGAGAFNLGISGSQTLTISGTANTFTGLFTVNSGVLAIDGDGSLGTDPSSFVANDITLNGAPGASFRFNATGITLPANRGITLGASGGCLQVAGGAGTSTVNGIIGGSGTLQDGVNSGTGAGILALGASESYTNWTIISCGTFRLLSGADIGNSAGILMSNAPTLDVSADAPFNLSTTNSFAVISTTNIPTVATILGAAGSQVNFGSQPIDISFQPFTNGDATPMPLTVLQSGLTLNGNTINVTNTASGALDVGDYALIQCTNGITISSPLTVNLVGNQMPNTTAQLVVINNILVMQVIPTASYTDSSITNQAPYPGLSVSYGTSSVTVSGTINGTNGTYPAQGETVTITVSNLTSTATVGDSTGDFTNTLTINTLPAGVYPIALSYNGPTTAPALDTSLSLTVTKDAVTVTATNQTKTYGQLLPTGAGSTAFTDTGLLNGETIGTVTLAFSGSPLGNATNAPAFTYNITPSAATGGTFNINNYNITYVAGTLTVNPLPIILTGTNVYNGTASAPYNSMIITNKAVSSDVVTNVSGSVTLASQDVGSESIISPGTLTIGGPSATNYTTVGATGSVTVKPLAVGLTGTRNYDGTTTAQYAILTITNIAAGDTLSLVSGTATLASKAPGNDAITSAAGLTLGGSSAANYTLTGAIGSVAVTQLPVGLTGTRFYDGTAIAQYSILTITNVVPGDTVNLASGSATLASFALGSESITSAAGLTLGGAQAADYTVVGAVGSVSVTSNPSPTSITTSAANGALTLSWPLDHTGWTLEVQTNSVTAGIGSNWVPVTGSTATNQETIIMDPSQGCVFYQLLLP